MMRARARFGFTLIEILVAVGVVIILFAVVIGTVRPRLDTAEANALVRTLEAVRDGIVEFRRNVGAYPETLRLLSLPPDSQDPPYSDVTDDNICEAVFSSAQKAAWRGPYLAQRVTPDGIPAGPAVVSNQLTRDPAGSSVVGRLLITVTGVEATIANAVEAAMDPPPADLAAGSVRYSGTTLTYAMVIGGC